MKKIYFLAFVFFALYHFESVAQITITRNDFPLIGDNAYTLPCDSIYEGPAGANVTWDFTSLVCDTTAYKQPYFYTAPAFPDSNANLEAEWSLGWAGTQFQYYTDNSTFNLVYSHSWYMTSNSSSHYKDYRVMMRFPFTYTDAIIDSFKYDGDSWNKSSGASYSYGFGIDTTYADGWGTIVLPWATYNALRVKTISHSVDSSLSNGPVNHYFYNRYTWYTNGIRFPLLMIDHSFNYDSTSQQWKESGVGVIIYSTSRPVSVNEVNGNLPEFALKAGEEQGKYVLMLKHSNAQTLEYTVTDISGKILQRHSEKSMRESSVDIDIRNFKAGIYLLSVYGPSLVKTFKMIKVD